MPTLELHGFDEAAADHLIADARALLATLSYRGDIVFDRTFPGRVEDWDGCLRPFIRICSRRQDKIDEIRSLLNPLCDIETLVIGFFPQQQATPPGPEPA